MESFKTLYTRYRVRIFTFLTRLLGDRAAAEDCAHDVFLQLHEKAPLYRPDGKFSTWLYEIARNRGLDYLRRKKVRRAASLDAPLEPGEAATLADMIGGAEKPDAPAMRSEALGLLEKALASLEASDREVIALCDIEGLPHEEVGRIIGQKTPAVAVKLHRAHKKLAAAIGLKKDFLD